MGGEEARDEGDCHRAVEVAFRDSDAAGAPLGEPDAGKDTQRDEPPERGE
jgi:hypothetical protein